MVNRVNVITTAVTGIAIVCGTLWLAFTQPIVICAFLQEDPMDAAFCTTHQKLRNYEEQPEEAVDWLLAYHGEAPGVQVTITLLKWAPEEPDSFIDILSRLDDEETDQFINRLASAAQQSGMNDQFTETFSARKAHNERLRKIVERLEGQSR